jgi:hypothetical protein
MLPKINNKLIIYTSTLTNINNKKPDSYKNSNSSSLIIINNMNKLKKNN